MAIDDEKQKDYLKSIESFTKGLTSTNKTLLASARNEQQRLSISKLILQKYKEEAAGIGKTTAADKLKRVEIANQIRATRTLNKTLGAKGNALMFFGDMAIKAGKSLGKYFLDTAKSAGNTAANFLDAGERVKKYADLSKEFTGKLGKGFTKLFESLDFNVGIFKQLSLTGAGFNGSMMNLRDAAKAARMPILDFVDMIQRNSSVMAQLFGSVQSGVPQMADFNRRLRDVTRDELAQFGLNLDDTTEFLSTYLELERSRGATQRRTTAEVVAGTRDYAKNLVLLSKLTGKSVKELDEQTKAVAADGAFRAILADKSPKVAKGFEVMLGRFNDAGPLFGQLFKEVTAFGFAANISTAQLDMMSGGALVRAMRAFDGSEESIINLMNVLKESSAQGLRNSKSFAAATIASGDFAEQLTAFAKGAGIAIDPERIRAQMLATDEFTKSAVGGRDVFDAVKVSV